MILYCYHWANRNQFIKCCFAKLLSDNTYGSYFQEPPYSVERVKALNINADCYPECIYLDVDSDLPLEEKACILQRNVKILDAFLRTIPGMKHSIKLAKHFRASDHIKNDE